MPDSKYCYPGTDVLINKLNIRDANELFEAEKQLTFVRLQELQSNPVNGRFDFRHLQAIHKYIFQDVYEWGGKVRTVEIGKGNLFCTTACIQSYAESVFSCYYRQCYNNKDDREKFIDELADNYADLNALHPFREGNGRTQREFTRLLCLECGYVFDLSCTTHEEMLNASILSFNQGDNSSLRAIFSRAVVKIDDYEHSNTGALHILTSDDMSLEPDNYYYYYEYLESSQVTKYNEIYEERIRKKDKQ